MYSDGLYDAMMKLMQADSARASIRQYRAYFMNKSLISLRTTMIIVMARPNKKRPPKTAFIVNSNTSSLSSEAGSTASSICGPTVKSTLPSVYVSC